MFVNRPPGRVSDRRYATQSPPGVCTRHPARPTPRGRPRPPIASTRPVGRRVTPHTEVVPGAQEEDSHPQHDRSDDRRRRDRDRRRRQRRRRRLRRPRGAARADPSRALIERRPDPRRLPAGLRKAKKLDVAPKHNAAASQDRAKRLERKLAELRKGIRKAQRGPKIASPESVGVSQATLESIAACESGRRPERGFLDRFLPRQVPVRLRDLGRSRRFRRPRGGARGRAGLPGRAALLALRLEPLARLRLRRCGPSGGPTGPTDRPPKR